MRHVFIHSRVFCTLIVFSIIFCGSIPAYASEKLTDDAALRNLEGVFLKIVLGDILISRGVSVQQIEDELRTKLQSAGIKIYSLSELREIPGSPILIVEAQCDKMESLSSNRTALYAFIAVVSLFQLKTSDRNIAPIGESTWEAQDRGATFEVTDIRHYLAKLVDTFIHAHRSVNSKN